MSWEIHKFMCGVLSTSLLPSVGRESEEFTKFVPFVFLTMSAHGHEPRDSGLLLA